MMRLTIIFVLGMVVSACTMVTPPYQVSIENVQALKSTQSKEVQVGKISSDPKIDKISLRGSKLISSVGNSYGDYLANALEQELKLAKLWSGVSSTIVTGQLLTNDIDVSGFSTGTGVISAKFVVTTDNEVVYEKIISANIEFDSSFMGNIAIPNGQNNYMNLIQALIKNLFSDSDFIHAIKA